MIEWPSREEQQAYLDACRRKYPLDHEREWPEFDDAEHRRTMARYGWGATLPSDWPVFYGGGEE